MGAINQIDLLTSQFESVRRYTLMTLDGIRASDWFRIPDGCPTHVAWQVGHIAVANYHLALAIPRGERREDEELIPRWIREHFGRGSTPDPDPGGNPPSELISSVFTRVHEQIIKELPKFNERLLSDSVTVEHPMFRTKFGSLMWSIQHEYTHAGQISMVYRLFGRPWRF